MNKRSFRELEASFVYSSHFCGGKEEDMSDKELIDAALQARKHSYSPYSRFQVGAALLGGDGKLYTGCNIETASYGATNCAERTAFFKAVSEGTRTFQAIAIVGGKEGEEALDFCPPCGICRQVMMEFCSPKAFRILLAKSREEYQEFTLEELLPLGFGPGNLK